MTIALATCESFIKAGEPVSFDDIVLQDVLKHQGCEVVVIPWEQPQDYSLYDAVMPRSTWNSHLYPQQFLQWIHTVSSQSMLLNPAVLMQWNMHKQNYYRLFSNHHISVVPYKVVHHRSSLSSIIEQSSWRKMVLKPTIGANAYHVMQIDADDRISIENGQQCLERSTCPFLLQPYLPSIEADDGERNYVFLGGEFSHAFSKQAFRPRTPLAVSSEEHVVHHIPSKELVLATQAIACVQQRWRGCPLVYGRIDIVDIQGHPYILECELVEPMLHLEYQDGAQKLAKSILEQVSKRRSLSAVSLPTTPATMQLVS